MSFSFVIQGEERSLKNSRIITRSGNRPRLIKSSAYRSWERAAILQLNTQWHEEPLEGPLWISVISYFSTRRMLDLDNMLAGAFDVLERAGIIENDRQVESVDGSRKALDRENPRVEIEIQEMP